MKNYFYLTAAAVLVLASCSESEFVGENPSQKPVEKTAMSFAIGTKGQSRANSYGKSAADLLNGKFTVEGTKGSPSLVGAQVVFDNYDVVYGLNTAENTTSNAGDWEYVGLAKNANSSIAGMQEIKYWDYSAPQYDFIAYSLGTGAATATKIVPGSAKTAAYTVQGTKSDLTKVYIADVVTKTTPYSNAEVGINFRALAAKVRIAIYETIPGYSVRGVEFFESATASTEVATPTLFSAGNAINTDGTYKVFFPTLDDPSNTDNNKAHVAYTGTQVSTLALEALNLTRTETATNEPGEVYIGTTAATATYAADKAFTTVLPNETAEALTLRVNYTLVSNDGSGETIKVYGATAVVPAIYTSWKSNYTYTYIFKISDKTNGSTEALGGAEGLHPITFDAVVLDPEEGNAATVNNVGTPSITLYQANFTGTNAAELHYNAGDIYVMVQDGAAIKNDLATKGQLYTLASVATEAEVMDALNMGTVAGSVTTGRNGVVLTTATSDATVTAIPGVDGNEIAVAAGTAAKIEAVAGTYAYVYTVSTGTPSTYNTAVIPTSGTDLSVGYYTDFQCTVAASGTADGSSVYYQTLNNNNNVYAVKVITVE